MLSFKGIHLNSVGLGKLVMVTQGELNTGCTWYPNVHGMRKRNRSHERTLEVQVRKHVVTLPCFWQRK